MRRSMLRRIAALAACTALATGVVAGVATAASAGPRADSGWSQDHDEDEDGFFVDFLGIFDEGDIIVVFD